VLEATMTESRRKNLRLPADVADRIEEVAEQKNLNQNELVTKIVEDRLGTDEDTEVYLNRRRDALKNKEQNLREQIENLGLELRDIRQKKRGIATRLEQAKEERRSLKAIFDEILDDMNENPQKNIDAYKGSIVETIRTRFDSGPTETKRESIISDIQNRASDRSDIMISPDRFMRGGASGQQSQGLTSNGEERKLSTKQKLTGGDTDGE